MNMFRAWYVPFYFYGVIHGDLHLGNYSIDADLNINLMDLGPSASSVLNLWQELLSYIAP